MNESEAFVDVIGRNACAVTPPEHLTGRVMKLNGRYNRTVEVYHQLRQYGEAGDRYTAGGWCCAYGKGTRGDTEGICRIEVLFTNGGTVWSSGGRIDFNGEEGSWQYASGSITAPVKHTACRFRITYTRQINHACFTNLYLYAEPFGEELGYDGRGNKLTVKALSGLTPSAEYDAYNNLTKHTQAGRSAPTVMEYGTTANEKKKHLLLKSTGPMNVIQEYTYNGQGNPITARTRNTTGTAYIRSEQTYTEDGNHVKTIKDARGKTITFQTDASKGIVTSVTDPKGQTANYTYDTLRRLTQSTAVMSGKTYENVYIYTGDELTGICHNTTGNPAEDVVYTFAYDGAKRPAEVNVGTQRLSQTAYNADGTIGSVTYGNGGKVTYTYDAFKRLTGSKYDTDTTERYRYAYNASGTAAYVEDTVQGRIIQSEYDEANRPVRVKTHENGTHVYTGELSYDVYGNAAQYRER